MPAKGCKSINYISNNIGTNNKGKPRLSQEYTSVHMVEKIRAHVKVNKICHLCRSLNVLRLYLQNLE